MAAYGGLGGAAIGAVLAALPLLLKAKGKRSQVRAEQMNALVDRRSEMGACTLHGICLVGCMQPPPRAHACPLP